MQPQQRVMSDHPSIVVDPVLLQSPLAPQGVLYFTVDRDDIELLRSEEGEWLRALYALDWREYRVIGAQYYQALFEFNLEAARKRQEQCEAQPNPESKEEATVRLLFGRPTGGNTQSPRLFPLPDAPVETPTVDLERLAPGVIPTRLAGKPPKCFFAMFKAFIGVHLMGREASADEVRHHLDLSPPFARACGFTLRDPAKGYQQTDVPSLRKLEQFDQIMSSRGLWTQARIQTIRNNLKNRVIVLKGERLVHDATHYVAYSAMDVHEIPDGAGPVRESTEVSQPRPTDTNAAPARKPPRRSKRVRRELKMSQRQQAREEARRRWQERRIRGARRGRKHKKRLPKWLKKGDSAKRTSAAAQNRSPPSDGQSKKQPLRKSQSRTIKNCRCPDRDTCPHEWVLSDPGAGTVSKGRGAHKKKYWAHKAAVLSTTSGIPLDARPATDAASHDGTLLEPHLDQFFDTYPELEGVFQEVLADSSFDDAPMKQRIEERHGLKVKTSMNPRGIKPVTENLPKGMKSLNPTGTLTCQADREMDFLGIRFGTEEFIYGPPDGRSGESACVLCHIKDECCRRGTVGGRHVVIKFGQLPHIDPSDPPMARRFKVLMRMRTAVERAIKRIKFDFGDDRLARRGNDAFLAHLDRSLIAYHLMLRLE